jgi:hypothetical protein
METLSILEKRIKAYVITDEVAGVFTVFSTHGGGTIISDKNKNNAIELFKEAMNVSCTMENIEAFVQASKQMNNQLKKEIVSKRPHCEIKFIDATFPTS